jgi:hypothetical protein
MRLLSCLVIFAFVLGAVPALAQSSASPEGRVAPLPKRPEQKPDEKPASEAAKPSAPKHAARPAATKHAAKPTAAKHAAKPAAVKPVAKSPVASQVPVPAPAVAKPAATKSVVNEPAPAKSEEKKFEPAPEALADIPPAERLKIRSELLWSGDYPAAVAGDDPMQTAIKNFQKRSKNKVTGMLTPSERATLVAAAEAHEHDFGWSVVTDPATGIRVGLPTKLVPNARDAAHGTRWSAAHGEVQVETFRIKDPTLKLSGLFEREKKEPSTRKIESSVLHDDDFFISGMQGLKKFIVRAQMRDGEIRGLTMTFDQMMETIVEPVLGAMSSAFSPFPERNMPFAALAKPVEYGNGLVVSGEGHIVTDRTLTQGCQVIVADGLGNADRVADDPTSGLALLRVYGPRKLSPLSFARDVVTAGDLTLIGLPDPKEQNGNRQLTEIKARAVNGTAIELRQPVPMAGFSGAAALNGDGHFLGMIEMRTAVLASAEPAAPPVRLVSANAIRDFLAAHKVKAVAGQSADAKASVVRVICVRK